MGFVQHKTFMGNVAVGVIPLLIVPKNTQRKGLVIANRSATQVYLGRNEQISATATSVIRLLQNEMLTLLQSEGDDVSEAIYAVASGASIVEIVESVKT